MRSLFCLLLLDYVFRKLKVLISGIVAAVASCGSPLQLRRQDLSSSRSLGEFAMMLHTATGRCWSHYVGYGNYCGLGGYGNPVDDTDACCLHHDACYTASACTAFWGFQSYTERYSWSMNGIHAICGTNQSACASGLCECDRIMSECLRVAKFNPNYAPSGSQNKPPSTDLDGFLCFM